MARKIINTTHSANSYDILSQTPKNYDMKNYFIKELQDKIDAEWEYRPNRVDIEYENSWGLQEYSPIEVVVQTVRSEKGTHISDDCRNIVFRNISESRFKIGSRFRLPSILKGSSIDLPDTKKNIWLATNTNSVKMTSSMIIERCNGVLGSLYRDPNGISHRHYEPVIQGKELSGARLSYNDVTVSPQSQLLVIAQHNDYTRDYFINQRFIVGYDKVYRIQAINKFYGNSTFDAEDVGLMYIYLELTETSPYDDFETRIASQVSNDGVINTQTSVDNNCEYSIDFGSSFIIPDRLTSQVMTFKPQLKSVEDSTIQDVPIYLDYYLENLPSGVDISNYVQIQQDGENFQLSRKRTYFKGFLVLTWYVRAEDSPTHERIELSLKLKMSTVEIANKEG